MASRTEGAVGSQSTANKKSFPRALEIEMKGLYVALEVVSVGMAVNLLASAGRGQDATCVLLLAASCFLVTGIVAVWFIQRIEAANAAAMHIVLAEAILDNPTPFKDVYSEEVMRGRLAKSSNWILGLALILALVGGALWFQSTSGVTP